MSPFFPQFQDGSSLKEVAALGFVHQEGFADILSV